MYTFLPELSEMPEENIIVPSVMSYMLFGGYGIIPAVAT
jgi:hypothetical protein